MKTNSLILLMVLILVSCKGDGGGSSNNEVPGECNYNLGDVCNGGLYVGKYQGADIVVTPSGCTDSSTPVCDGSIDTVTKRFRSITFAGMPTSGGSSLDDGRPNTNAIVSAIGIEGEAAKYCQDLVYGGFDDWYLPAYSEFIAILNNVFYEPVGTFNLLEKTYWSSYEQNCAPGASCGWALTVNEHGGTTEQKDVFHHVRCFRRI